jgi:hypothetical protein
MSLISELLVAAWERARACGLAVVPRSRNPTPAAVTCSTFEKEGGKKQGRNLIIHYEAMQRWRLLKTWSPAWNEQGKLLLPSVKLASLSWWMASRERGWLFGNFFSWPPIYHSLQLAVLGTAWGASDSRLQWTVNPWSSDKAKNVNKHEQNLVSTIVQ